MDRVEQWRKDASADGWLSYPTYPGHEDESRMATMEKDGWKALVDNRPVHPNGHDERGVTVWDSDGIAVPVEFPYSMEALLRGLRTCMFCGATDVDTRRVSFAGRCCLACLPDQRKKLEYPGWYN